LILSIHDLSVELGGNAILKSVDLQVEQGEIVCLLGPSGCGKTTLLRAVAGLEKAQSGSIRIGDKDQIGMPVHERPVGLMFQDLALFPHMNVAQNIGFGLRMKGVSQADREARTKGVLDLVGLVGFEARDVSSLSGGEQQRVALARSLAPNPRLLMLDEPLSSLDASLRERLVGEIRDIIKSVQISSVYVTHDQHEAFAVADRIAVMNAGRIEQIDTPERIYWNPQSAFVAHFLGLRNVVDADWLNRSLDRHLSVTEVKVLLHPDKLRVGSDGVNTLTGKLVNQIFQGRTLKIEVEFEGRVSLRLETTSSVDDDEVKITFDDDAIIFLKA